MIGLLLNITGLTLMIIGSLFFFLGALGMVRMPDLYNRMQASTKTTTLGLVSFVMGVGFLEPYWFVKTLIISVFILITSPIGASALARASYRSGVKLTEKTVINEYEGVKW